MKIVDRIREWVGMGDDDKVALDRRAFLKGMVVTSAGLLVAGPTVFDMGRRIVAPTAEQTRVLGGKNPCGEIPLGEAQDCTIQVAHGYGFAPGDIIQISGGGNDNTGLYVVTAIENRFPAGTSTMTMRRS